MRRSDFVESGAEGGRIAASRMTPEQRSERARKAAKARQAKVTANCIARIKDGSLDLVRAASVAEVQKRRVQLLKLTAKTQASGTTVPFFAGAPVVGKQEIEQEVANLREMRRLIKQRKEGKL